MYTRAHTRTHVHTHTLVLMYTHAHTCTQRDAHLLDPHAHIPPLLLCPGCHPMGIEGNGATRGLHAHAAANQDKVEASNGRVLVGLNA